MRLIRVEDRDLGAIEAALRDAGLPFDDLREAGRQFYRGPPGCFVGLEIFGEDALLRSMVVPATERGKGVGQRMVAALIECARAHGICRLWLLTTTAEPFFTACGFARAERVEAPAPIRGTREHRDLCPASATLMTLEIPRGG